MAEHAKLFSPSKADGWFACPGRIVMEADFPDSSNQASADGTARHEVCADALGLSVLSVNMYVGTTMSNGVVYRAEWVAEDQDYIDTVRALAGECVLGVDWFVEHTVNFEAYTDAPSDSFGTADAILFKPLPSGYYELIVIDRKTGYYEVSPERNKQMVLYALGAYEEFRLSYDISSVRLIIHQRSAKEWVCTIEDLLAFGEEVRVKAQLVADAVQTRDLIPIAAWYDVYLNPDPSEDACRYCRAMAVCPSMQRKVQEVVGMDFVSLAGDDPPSAYKAADSVLADAMAAVGTLRAFADAVEAETARRLQAGAEVPGYKLVLGRQGNRAWADPVAAEKMLREQFRLTTDQAYDRTLISPTSAEALTKGEKPVIGPRRWKELQPMIWRPDRKPIVVPLSDKREAYVPLQAAAADDFEPIQAAEPGSDLC